MTGPIPSSVRSCIVNFSCRAPQIIRFVFVDKALPFSFQGSFGCRRQRGGDSFLTTSIYPLDVLETSESFFPIFYLRDLIFFAKSVSFFVSVSLPPHLISASSPGFPFLLLFFLAARPTTRELGGYLEGCGDGFSLCWVTYAPPGLSCSSRFCVSGWFLPPRRVRPFKGAPRLAFSVPTFARTPTYPAFFQRLFGVWPVFPHILISPMTFCLFPGCLLPVLPPCSTSCLSPF